MKTPWWHGGVIYQIYPRSFFDSSGDGVGDLPGIEAKLDYIQSLGVDAVWLSPIFPSPMKDFGYDVSDHRAVDSSFGTLEDFDRLLEGAHRRGLKVILDMVLSHTSDRHRWFEESRRDRHNPRSDWYVWQDARRDGTPPTNWLSVFGGSAWTWDATRAQYYLHNFLPSQPNLDLSRPEVVEAQLAEVESWLKRGIDGLRLDAVQCYVADSFLRDNPPLRDSPSSGRERIFDPYDMQVHIYDQGRPEVATVLEQIRALVDRYPERLVLAEVDGPDAIGIAAEYTKSGRHVHSAYTFLPIRAAAKAEALREVLEEVNDRFGEGWPTMMFSNHDVVRAVSRFSRNVEDDERVARMLIHLLGSVRGLLCFYQGEELGLGQVEVDRDRIVDPAGLPLWPRFEGRDGCRTPMPWVKEADHAGFSKSEPWLPVPEAHRARAVDVQETTPNSVLTHFRRFARARRAESALVLGSIEYLDATEPILALSRTLGDHEIVCVFNISDSPATYSPGFALEPKETFAFEGRLDTETGQVHLPPWGTFFGAAAGRPHPPVRRGISR